MNGHKIIETKLWSGTSMLTSGVLTNLIYELLSGSSYNLDIDGKHYEITAAGMNSWCAIGVVVLTFFSLWALISLLIPFLLRIRRRFAYDKVKQVSAKELLKVLDEAGATIKEIYPIFNAESKDSSSDNYLKLYSRDVEKTILPLHGKFLPPNKRLRKRIETYFRHYQHSSIISIEQKISSYELAANVALLRCMVEKLNGVAGEGTLLKKDCKEMVSALDELEQMYPLISYQAKRTETDNR